MTKKPTDARPVPTWAAGLIAVLARDRPAVVTRDQVAGYLEALGEVRDLDQTLRDLQQLGWLATLHLRGVWAFVPPGHSEPADSYLDVRAWRARDPEAVFALAGEAAAWHLGYLPRRFEGTLAVWLPVGQRVPHGLRSSVSLVRIDWSVEDARHLGPSPRLLRKKGLDLTAWAGGLPALGPDALLVQLAGRPGSFRSWPDLIGQLEVLAGDCDPERVAELLGRQSASAWQRAAYLLERGGREEDGLALLQRRKTANMPTVPFGDGPAVVWSKAFRINDRLIAPLQRQLGKA
jgi:hypothetical protein